MNDYLPSKLIEEIKQYIKESSLNGEMGWESSNQDEDSLTGDYFSQLRRDWVEFDDWAWRITYRKFRGRGKGAYEKEVGADGIFSIEIKKNDQIDTKSIIFQSKKVGNDKIQEQLRKMEETLPQGNMVLSFSPDGYYGIIGQDYNREDKKELTKRIGDFWGDVFIGCQHGQWGVSYDTNTNKLVIGEKQIDTFIENVILIEVKKE